MALLLPLPQDHSNPTGDLLATDPGSPADNEPFLQWGTLMECVPRAFFLPKFHRVKGVYVGGAADELAYPCHPGIEHFVYWLWLAESDHVIDARGIQAVWPGTLKDIYGHHAIAGRSRPIGGIEVALRLAILRGRHIGFNARWADSSPESGRQLDIVPAGIRLFCAECLCLDQIAELGQRDAMIRKQRQRWRG